MSWRRKLLQVANSALSPAGVRLLPMYEYHNMLTTYRGQEWNSPALSAADLAYLDVNNPRLADLRRRYAGHPAAAHTQWNEPDILQDMALQNFRGDNHYVYQVRYSPSPQTYFVTAYYVRDHDKLGIFGRLIEDGQFGAYTLPFEGGYLVSRDLMQSINEINVIYRMLGRSAQQSIRLLDIGAGYGRLAHRLTEAFPGASVACTDAVPLSTFLSEFYLQFRGVHERASVVPLDEAETVLTGQGFDLISNIHSFSECQLSVIEWWMHLIENIDVSRMMIVPNARDQFLSTESDGTHQDFLRLLTRFGWRLVHKEPIYGASIVANEYGLYPNFCFHWFERS